MPSLRGFATIGVLGLLAWGAPVEHDCTGIESDIARTFQTLLRKARTVKAPPNACALSLTVRAAQSDRTLEGAKEESVVRDPVDFDRGYDFYLRSISDLLSRPFYRYNLGYAPKRANNKNSYYYRIGPPAEAIEPHGVEVFAKETIVKQHSGGSTCGFKVDVNIVWLVSLPQNSVSGEVKDKEGKPLKKGRIRFTRKGPNNGETNQFEAPIRNGRYQTEPNLPSGHYRIELIEPDTCAGTVTHEWIFLSSRSHTYDFATKCKKERHYFTAEVESVLTRRYKPIDGYRGATDTLEKRREEHHIYYLYVDEANGRVLEYHPDKRAGMVEMKEYYWFDLYSCGFKKGMKGDTLQTISGSRLVHTEDSGWGFEDTTQLAFGWPWIRKRLTVSWGELKKRGHYSGVLDYRQEGTPFEKSVNDFFAVASESFRKIMQEPGKAVDAMAKKSYPGERELQCDAATGVEGRMFPKVRPEDRKRVRFSVHIRPASESEKRVLKRLYHLSD